MKISEITQFLAVFGHKKILCYNVSDSRVSKMAIVDLEHGLHLNKTADRDLYFYINNGGTKTNEMVTNAYFTDLDAGKDEEGNYFLDKKVAEIKKKMLKKIQEFPLVPSFVCETRNGYQVYWIMKDIDNKITWDAVQGKICNYFKDVGSDSRTKKINQIYRVPGTIWHKNWTGLKPFTTKLIPIGGRNVTAQLANPLGYHTKEFKKVLEDVSPVTHRNAYSENYIRFHKAKIEPVEVKISKPSKKKDTEEVNVELLAEIKEFLLESATTLKYAGKKFSGQCALQLAERLAKEFCV